MRRKGIIYQDRELKAKLEQKYIWVKILNGICLNCLGTNFHLLYPPVARRLIQCILHCDFPRIMRGELLQILLCFQSFKAES